MKCDECSADAVYHLTEIVEGRPVTRYLCPSCGKGIVPSIPGGPARMAVAKLSAEARRCARCQALTEVVLYGEEVTAPDRTVKRFRCRIALCAACAGAEGVAYTPAPAEHVALVFRP